MLIRSEFDIQFQFHAPVAVMAMLHLHPSLDPLLRSPDILHVDLISNEGVTPVPAEGYIDCFGNRCERFLAPQGLIRLSGNNTIEQSDYADEAGYDAIQHSPENLPSETLQFLLSSRYCQVDQMSHAATDLFGTWPKGWALASAIRDWVHNHVRFDYATARPTKTALDVFTERVGVCRDFQHLAITLTRAMNIPARYVTGHLGDIRHPDSGPGDFSAWYQVFLGGRWWTMDARHNDPRVGRVLMATGRDATDVALTTSFGTADLKHFEVTSYEIYPDGSRVPVLPALSGDGAPVSPEPTANTPETDEPQAFNAN
ncbi:MAG TPA: transglutaminase family protein [Acidobacteriaceae bacterium]